MSLDLKCRLHPVENFKHFVEFPTLNLLLETYDLTSDKLYLFRLILTLYFNQHTQDPVKLKSWGEQVLDATKEGPACLQVSYLDGALKGQEDCLILNVYTPSASHSS